MIDYIVGTDGTALGFVVHLFPVLFALAVLGWFFLHLIMTMMEEETVRNAMPRGAQLSTGWRWPYLLSLFAVGLGFLVMAMVVLPMAYFLVIAV